MFCCTLLYVHSSIAIILMGRRELVAFLNLSSWCLVMVEQLFLAVPWGCLRFVIVVFPDHTHLLFLCYSENSKILATNEDNFQDDFILSATNMTSQCICPLAMIIDLVKAKCATSIDNKKTRLFFKHILLKELQQTLTLDKAVDAIIILKAGYYIIIDNIKGKRRRKHRLLET